MMENFFRKEVLQAPLYAVHPEEGIKLNQNESPWDLPMELKIAITEKLIRSDFNRYPLDEPTQIKKKISKKFGVMPDQIVLTGGTNIIIQALVAATSINGRVLIVDPTFSVYEIQAKLFGNKVISIPLNDDFSLPTEAILRSIKKEKPSLIFIPNPNAPTGNLFDKEGLHRIVRSAGCLTVIDEAYHPFANDTVLEWLPESQNLVVLRTFSKAYAIAGVRFGFALCDSEVAAQLEKMMLPFRIPVTTCAIIESILENPEYVERYVRDISKARDRLFVKMQEIAGIKVFRSDANYILFKIEHARAVYQRLLKSGVVVRNISNDGRLKDCLRVSVGTDEENQLFLKSLKKAVG